MTHLRTLDQIDGITSVRVREIKGGWNIRQRLNQMGIHVHDELAVKQRGKFKGPVLIEVHGIQVALGRGMAKHIIVENDG